MTKRDYYEVLGLKKGATKDEIKAAYRKLAMQFHPDRNKDHGAEAKFKEISEAYAVLSDDNKRAQYDQYGHAGFDQMYSREDIFRSADFSDFEDLFANFGFGAGAGGAAGGDPFASMFGSMFQGSGFGGRGRGGRRREYGSDLLAEVEVTLEDAAKGTKKEISYHHTKACKKCNGSGAESGSGKKSCSSCNGRGQVQQARRMGPMQFYTVTTCNKCHGEGTLLEKACKDCSGSGRTREYEHIYANIPAGIQDGMKIRLEGLGEYGRDGSGDLYVNVSVSKHEKFEREGDNLWTSVPIPFTLAALGGELEVPTLFGKAKLHIPAGTQTHTVFRLRAEGMPSINKNDKGDELVRVVVEVPKKLSKKQKELLGEFDKDCSGSVDKKEKGGLFGFG